MRIFLYLLVLLTSAASAQQNVTTYYKDKGIGKTENKRQAAYAQTITTHADSTKTITLVQLKTETIVSQESYKGMEPVGKWIYTPSIGASIELDYNFQLNYSDNICKTDSAAFINFKNIYTNPFIDNDSLKYVAPKLINARTIPLFVQQNIAYPSQALNNEISGTVKVQFILGVDGNFEAMAIIKSAGITLDKEAMRIVRKMRFKGSATLNGTMKKICVVLPIRFEIGD